MKTSPFQRAFWSSRRIYRTLLFIFCLAILVQLLVIMPLKVDDSVQESVSQVESQTETPNKTPNKTPDETLPSPVESAPGEASLDPTESKPIEIAGDQRMSAIHMLETREGNKDWELWSQQAQSIPENQSVVLTGVKSLFHAKEGVTYQVTGQKGMIEVPKKNLEVSGKVETQISNGYRFFTDDMQYSSDQRVLFTDSAVKVLGPPSEGKRALRLTGKGLKTNLNESRVEVLSDVRAEKVLEKGQRAVIRSDRARFDGNKVTASFLGQVVLDIDDMRITGPKADFLYDTKGDILKSVVFSGGARVSDPNKWATSDEVKVDFLQNQYVFSGSPRVVQNSDELRGEKIIFHDGGKRIQVIRAKAKIDRNRLDGEGQ